MQQWAEMMMRTGPNDACVILDIYNIFHMLRGQGRPWPGPAESGLTPRARVKGQQKEVGPGLAWPLDSVCAAFSCP
jgi:hypothetical protein